MAEKKKNFIQQFRSLLGNPTYANDPRDLTDLSAAQNQARQIPDAELDAAKEERIKADEQRRKDKGWK